MARIKCECTRPGVNHASGEIYEVGKSYVIDDDNPRNLAFFDLPKDVKKSMEDFLKAEKAAKKKLSYADFLAEGGKEGDELDAMGLEELQAKAQELGLEFSAKAKEKKLRDLIRAALPDEGDE